MSKILITGASGLIGTRLTEMLLESGHEVAHLVRSKREGGIPTFLWDIQRGYVDPKAFEGVDAVIHLAGAGIADKRWSKQRKKEILESRTHSTRVLVNAIQQSAPAVKTFVSASAIGYYGFEDDEKIFKENDLPGRDFLANVVRQWEQEVDALANTSIRTVKVRVGIVFSNKGGALKEIVKPVKFYAGAPLGSGKQKISWIHIDDMCGVFQRAVEDASFQGAINGVGPNPITNEDLTRKIARVIGRPVLLPNVPGFVLRLVLGEMADLVLKGNSVSNSKLESLGFKYKFNTVDEALYDLLGSR